MSIQAVLWELKATAGGSFPPFLILLTGMFIGVVAGPLMLFVIGGSVPATSGYPDLHWGFMAISLLLLVGISIGLLMFRRVAGSLSLSPKYI